MTGAATFYLSWEYPLMYWLPFEGLGEKPRENADIGFTNPTDVRLVFQRGLHSTTIRRCARRHPTDWRFSRAQQR